MEGCKYKTAREHQRSRARIWTKYDTVTYVLAQSRSQLQLFPSLPIPGLGLPACLGTLSNNIFRRHLPHARLRRTVNMSSVHRACICRHLHGHGLRACTRLSLSHVTYQMSGAHARRALPLNQGSSGLRPASIERIV